MSAAAILALIAGAVQVADGIADLILKLKQQATEAGASAEDVQAAVAEGRAAAAKLREKSSAVLDRIGTEPV